MVPRDPVAGGVETGVVGDAVTAGQSGSSGPLLDAQTTKVGVCLFVQQHWFRGLVGLLVRLWCWRAAFDQDAALARWAGHLRD